MPENLPKKSSNKGNDGSDENASRFEDSSLKREISDEAARVLPTPSVSPKLETEEVTLDEKKSENAELQEIMEKDHIIPSYDGMQVEI